MPKAKMTLDRLARMSQNEFTEIRGEMKKGFAETKEDSRLLRADMEAGFQGVSETMKAILGELHEIKMEVVDHHDLRARVERLEKKMELRR